MGDRWSRFDPTPEERRIRTLRYLLRWLTVVTWAAFVLLVVAAVLGLPTGREALLVGAAGLLFFVMSLRPEAF